ncbi:alpha-glucoside transport system substrate-binding protein [Motilibacter peucedani]|uniref:Alpha-glucoside transport system substrate-binding protein n=1 Tax=Motilibacter peucedani TaxID=598650 RepID=A0A420XRR3_9ACTN|nr:ABC transporter substrate-binding protein [Motilibacter peucedani]RKS77554.1 alpha-glucoside transport system substrate-binding protein [Motilibacter peucedani]
MSKRTLRHGGVVVASLALALTACGGSSGGGSDASAPAGSTGASAAAGSDVKDGLDCTPYKAFGDLKGKQVSIYTSIVAPEDQPQIDSYKPFEACTGVKVNYEGNKAFENQLQVRIAGGNAPDIAYIPQPGLLQKVVATGKAIAAPQQVSDNVDKYFGKDWRAYGSVDGKLYAAPLGANVKSFVWYSPKAFEDKGYTVPTTWDEMTALSDKIAADNPDDKPWCVGFGSGDATGWPGTDWLEDVLLRTAGADVYDKWVNHTIPFNDPQVATALAKVGSIIKNPKYVNGGLGDVKSIATTEFSEAGQPILDGGCWMHRQASFYAANWPKGTDISEHGDVYAFYLPPIDPSKGKPVLGAGEFVASFRDAPEVSAFRTYLSSPEWANIKAKLSSGWVSANKGADIANFKNPIDALSVKILQDPNTVFRFDGSDQMPAAVGAGSFWKGMTDWITGKSDSATLADIEKTWPKS